MNVVELLDERKVIHVERGRDYVVSCFNPEHDDSNPSMRIDKITGLFNCLSCGYSGDIYNYYKINKNKFIDIKVEMLKEKMNNLMKRTKIDLPLDATLFNKDFRGISADTLNHFGGFTTDKVDGMEGRLVFPIKDLNDITIGLQGRFIYSDLEPKYKFYPSNVKVPLFPAKPEPINNSIILVEGFFDLLNLWDKGLKNVVCTFGTAFGSVKKKHKQAINRDKLLTYKYQGIDTIYIMYDGDKSGRDSANNLMNYINQTFHTDTIDLDDGVDPGSLSRSDVINLKELLYD